MAVEFSGRICEMKIVDTFTRATLLRRPICTFSPKEKNGLLLNFRGEKEGLWMSNCWMYDHNYEVAQQTLVLIVTYNLQRFIALDMYLAHVMKCIPTGTLPSLAIFCRPWKVTWTNNSGICRWTSCLEYFLSFGLAKHKTQKSWSSTWIPMRTVFRR